MYLQNVLKQTPRLLQTSLELHQQGRVPANTWVIDLDTIAENAKALANEAGRLGLSTYIMSKQHNRNPYINALSMAMGLGPIVAVDSQCAVRNMRYGIPLGHVGHLNQIPKGMMPLVASARPEVWTVYSLEHAQFIDQVARDQGYVQGLLLRVWRPGDMVFNGIEAGIALADLPALVRTLKGLKHVRIDGVTAFPVARYNSEAGEPLTLTQNLETINLALEELAAQGVKVTQVNMPGNTSTLNMAALKAVGATHVEPGNALLGTTPSNAFTTELAEKTAFAYVSEITHWFDGKAFGHGGGCYHTNYNDRIQALIGSTWAEAKDNLVEYHWNIKQDIDYHMQYRPTAGQKVKVGDSTVLAYRTQMHMTRSWLAPVSGISGKRPLKVHYLFDNATTALDDRQVPVSDERVKADIAELLKSY